MGNMWATALAAAIILTGGRAAAQREESRPNVIFILTDDMGTGDLSCYGGTLDVKTPHIDRLAAQGKKFDRFYVAMPICSPSRAAILSGMFSPETQLTNYLQERRGNFESDQNDYLEPKRARLPRSFQAAGYATCHVGKWHLGGGRDIDNAPSILRYGYDEAYATWEAPRINRDPKLGINHAPWDKNRSDPGQVPRHARTRHMVDRTLDFLARHQGKPCFITLWPDDLHTPFWPSPEMQKKYGGSGDDDSDIRNFYGVLEEYDRQIGRLQDGLKKLGLDHNTIVVFTGDNGPAPHYKHQRTNGMRGGKLSLYEGGIRQPLLIKWPAKIQPGTTDKSSVLAAVDMLPTLTALAGIKMIDDATTAGAGVDRSQVITGNSPAAREKPLLWEYGRTNRVPRPRNKKIDDSPNLAAIAGDFKLLVNRDGSRLELYNVATDPTENKNLAKEKPHQELVKTLQKTLMHWSQQLPHRTHPYPPVQKNNGGTTGSKSL